MSSIVTILFLGHKRDLWLWRSLQKHIHPLIRTDHLDNTVLGCCTELPFGPMPCSLSLFLSLSLSFPRSLLLICLARFVVWAWFALKSVNSMGIRKLEWTECIQLLAYCKTLTARFYVKCTGEIAWTSLSVSLSLTFFSAHYQSLGPLDSDETEAPRHVARHWW